VTYGKPLLLLLLLPVLLLLLLTLDADIQEASWIILRFSVQLSFRITFSSSTSSSHLQQNADRGCNCN
jgi:hypothetical protein